MTTFQAMPRTYRVGTAAARLGASALAGQRGDANNGMSSNIGSCGRPDQGTAGRATNQEVRQMATMQDIETWRGRTLVDRDGDKIGTIEDIYLDRQSGEPEWVAVKT